MTTGVSVDAGSSSPTTRYHVSCAFQVMRPSCSVTSASLSGLIGRLRRDGRLAGERMVAGGEAPAPEVGERRLHCAADLGRVAATRMEATPARRVDGARHLALEDDALPRRSRLLVVRLDRRD